ncbi:MAG: FHA domain-containing protein [Bacteroidales bacterium]|nr:FHA domain-containing protein [Bacteroidales bacterium]
MKHFLLSGILLFSVLSVQAQKITTIDDIVTNPYNYKLESVQVEGYVEQFIIDKNETTEYYLLKSNYGNTIRVYTGSGTPEVLKWYRVTGTIIYDDQVKKMAIAEVTRTMIKEEPESNTNLGAVEEGAAGIDMKKEVNGEETEDEESNLLLYILIGAGLIVLALIVVLVLISMKRKAEREAGYSQPAAEGTLEKAEAFPTDDFQTIKIAVSTPKTMKFIPGELKIVSGEDQGKSFKIAGYPTPEGNIVTIGREEIKGERAFSHIQLKQQTISRKQAEIISKEGKLFVKNLSETNLTQVDGVELQPGEEVELKPNSTIRAGELEFKYLV